MNLDFFETEKHSPKTDQFLQTIYKIFKLSRWFGLPTFGGKSAVFGAIVILILLSLIEGAAIWKLIRYLAGVANNTNDGRGLTARLSGAIFYGNALLSLILSWRFMRAWKKLAVFWSTAEYSAELCFPPDLNIRKRVLFVSVFVGTFACVEHMMSMMSATGFDCPPNEYFERYILSSHGFMLHPYEYSLWVAIPVFILSKVATILWNFQDLIIILVSMGLTSRYHRMNTYVKRIVSIEKRTKDIKLFRIQQHSEVNLWRRLREAYVYQSTLVRKVDDELGALILLSNLNNLYFICLQLFLGLRKVDGVFISRLYYFTSLGWLLFRACGVVLAAADVNLHSQRALPCLYSSPSAAYNVEIKRLKNQLTFDVVALSGKGFFTLQRQKLLEVAAVIIKYELILIQFDR